MPALDLRAVGRRRADHQRRRLLLDPAEGRDVVVRPEQDPRLARAGLRGEVGLPLRPGGATLLEPARPSSARCRRGSRAAGPAARGRRSRGRRSPARPSRSRSPERRAIRWITRNVYVSSSLVPNTMLEDRPPIAAAASATPSADQKESTVRSPSVMASAASSISASTTSTHQEARARRRTAGAAAATTGGRIAFSAAITAAATSAEREVLDVRAGDDPRGREQRRGRQHPGDEQPEARGTGAARPPRRVARRTWRVCSPSRTIPDASPRAPLVAEPRCRRVVVHRRGLFLECAAAAASGPRAACRAMSCVKPRLTTTRRRGEVLAVLREGVRRHLPAALAHRVRDVEDGEVLDLVLHA